MYYIDCGKNFVDYFMPEIKDNILDKQNTSRDASTKTVPEENHYQERSFGNKMFDMVIYPFFAFFLVAAVSIYSLVNAKSGGKFYESTVDKITGLFSFFAKNTSLDKVRERAKNSTDMLISFGTGTLFIAPIKLFEDKRKEVSHFFDKIHEKYFAGKEIDPEKYKPEPKQTWKSILGGRVIAFAIALTTATVFGNYVKEICSGITRKTPWGESPKGTEFENFTKAEKWTWATAYEGFYTALCALILYGASRILPKIFNKEPEIAKSTSTNPITNINKHPDYKGFKQADENQQNNSKPIDNIIKLGERKNKLSPQESPKGFVAKETNRPENFASYGI